MKLRLKTRDLVDLIVTRNYKEFQAKYSLSRKNLKSLKESLKNGKWRIADRCAE